MIVCKVCQISINWSPAEEKWVHAIPNVKHEVIPKGEAGDPQLRCTTCAEPVKDLGDVYIHDYVAVGNKLWYSRGVPDEIFKERIRGCSQQGGVDAVAGTYDYEERSVNWASAINTAMVEYHKDELQDKPGFNWADIKYGRC